MRYTLHCEGIADPTPAQVAEREELTRARVTRLLEHDLRALLERRFARSSVEWRELSGHAAQGYSGIVLAWAYG